MSQIFTLEIPDEIAERVREFAESAQRRVEDVMVEWIDRASSDIPVDSLPDEQVMALVNLQMNEAQQDELDELLDQQREDTLDEQGRSRLDDLMQVYRKGMVRKAQALQIAVERGLTTPDKLYGSHSR